MIKFLDLELQYKTINKQIEKSIHRVLEGGIFIGGKEVENFEKELAKFCGVKYAISVNSGTDALFLSLKALGIGSGDEVITTPFTFIATAGAIANCGAKPVFVDISPENFNIDAFKIEKVITKNTKAIIPVHIFGQMSEMSEIVKIAKKHNLYIIEDACQSIGAEYTFKKAGLPRRSGEKAGTIGTLGCFSFFPSKNLGSMGDGGMVVTNNKILNDTIRLLKNHGSSPENKYKNIILGFNSRLDSMQAAILNVKLKYLSKWNLERIKVANYYSKNLKAIKEIQVPIVKDNKTHVFHQYTLRLRSGPARDELKKYLANNGIPTMVYYPLPLHLQPALEYLNYKNGDFPEVEKACSEVLSLPIYPELSRKYQDLIIRKIKEFCQQ